MTCSLSAYDVSPEERQRLVEEYIASGVAQHEFAVAHGIATSTFWRWVRRYNGGEPQTRLRRPGELEAERRRSLGFAEVFLETGSSVGPTCSRPPVVLWLPGGVKVEVPSALLEDLLRRLLEAGAPC